MSFGFNSQEEIEEAVRLYSRAITDESFPYDYFRRYFFRNKEVGEVSLFHDYLAYVYSLHESGMSPEDITSILEL